MSQAILRQDSMSSEQESPKVIYDVMQLQEILPHRYPFLLLDRVVELEDNKRIVGMKNVTINEQFFQGHFPHKPVMPGVLILEAMAQTACILAKVSKDGVAPGKTVYLVGVNDVKWKKQVIPGDTLRIEMTSIRKRRPIWIMAGEVTVEGKVVASANISAVEAD